MQTLGGLAILIVVPVLTVLCLSPDVHYWLRASFTAGSHFQNPPKATENRGTSEVIKQYGIPNSISKIAEVSEEEPDLSKAAQTQSSDVSRAVLRLQHALQIYPNWSQKDIFGAVNGGEASLKSAPCPFERIDGEQSLLLATGKHGSASLTETLNRCAVAIEQMTGRER